MRHPEINPVMLIICPSGRSFEVAVKNTKQASIIRRVKKKKSLVGQAAQSV